VCLDALVYRYVARVEHHLLNNFECKGTAKVEWFRTPIELSINESTVDDDEAYPVSVSIVDPGRVQTNGTTTTVQKVPPKTIVV
jgi:hypothetical protein